ncbi:MULTISPECIES: pantoate--beta-alanine ligase [Acetobacter]|jgi:pantoate--beta-alanine ligase|uniref:Pantothenate synthetase n=1 Tax=Acetobacter lovaniensis TaxID=104100 RepID=A0A841QDI9_9PROT|nr:pantoate--beta-alanine ligase [Acetobacter lovaniensis]MBB6456192.1 pantoate--beta-alanine ligase [Acetobacter lovaniensis]MCI1697897.1 pantoate--beta-alanine ligase [Acetobacter lovaniensis]MCI1795397.1 pantoate--beta-alanine ligase [Acetobacter lovaniensis]MCP1239027.1 pantoate--beta-alanine ligase [Acetobacter lovaniensis]NHN80571.1 pantoate--beta-alanine ligase [Acetobacter lovaniensis]
MRIIRSRTELATLVAQWRNAGETIGFVPTMGSLHNGHLTLVNALDGQATRRIVSIFVNPIQFDNAADFQLYPRGPEADAALLEGTGKVDVLYAPDGAEMYPEGFATRITVSGLDDMLCGADRPGHFDGVATVVTKLLLQTGADIAAFGEKDYQQLCLIRRLVQDLNLPVRIKPVPTVREADGLALSSRNRRLTPQQREQAPYLPAALRACIADIQAGKAVDTCLQSCRENLKSHGFNVHYLELRSGDTLLATETLTPDARLFVAASLGDIRLIDNMPAA